MSEVIRLLRILGSNVARALRARAIVLARMDYQEKLGDALNGRDIVQVEDFLNEAVKADWILSLSRIWMGSRDDDQIKSLIDSNVWQNLTLSHQRKSELLKFETEIRETLEDKCKRLELLKFARVEGLAHQTDVSGARKKTQNLNNATIGQLLELTDHSLLLYLLVHHILLDPLYLVL